MQSVTINISLPISLSPSLPLSTSISILVIPWPPSPQVTIVLGLLHHIPLIHIPTKHNNPIISYSSIYIFFSFKLKMLVSLFSFFLLLCFLLLSVISSLYFPSFPLSLVYFYLLYYLSIILPYYLNKLIFSFFASYVPQLFWKKQPKQSNTHTQHTTFCYPHTPCPFSSIHVFSLSFLNLYLLLSLRWGR